MTELSNIRGSNSVAGGISAQGVAAPVRRIDEEMNTLRLAIGGLEDTISRLEERTAPLQMPDCNPLAPKSPGIDSPVRSSHASDIAVVTDHVHHADWRLETILASLEI